MKKKQSGGIKKHIGKYILKNYEISNNRGADTIIA